MSVWNRKTSMPEPDGVVGDLVCYSKLCTHAGCPVGLFRAREGELICPCHGAKFTLDGALDVDKANARWVKDFMARTGLTAEDLERGG